MPFPRSTASCGLFLALIVFNGVFSSADRSSRADLQQFVSDRPHQQHDGGYEQYYEQGPYGADEGHDDESYYKREPYHEEQDSEGRYDTPHGKHIVPICLQKTTTTTHTIDNRNFTI